VLKPIFQSPKDQHYFFGYYDKSQLNYSSTKLLAMRVDFLNRMPDRNDRAVIGYFNLKEERQRFVEVAVTRTFNWQQGCMLQWLGPDYESKIIYNDLEEDRFVSVILDLNSGESKTQPMPVYTVAPDGKSALCIDHERHYFCRRSYSYDGLVNKKKDKNIVPGDGIWRLDLESGETKRVVALEDLMTNKTLSNMEGGVHYLEHLMLSPSGNRLCFLHRWQMRGGGIFDRLYTVDPNGKNLYLLNDSGRVGHFCWRNDNEILLYGAIANPINSLRRYKNLVRYLFKPFLPVYHMFVADNSFLSKALTGDSYILLTDKSRDKRRVAPELSLEDGHPSFLPGNREIFISDTYPDLDSGSIAKLLQYNLNTGEYRILAELNSIADYDNTALRCDLHPKCSFDGKYISIDTMDRGVRGTYVYEVF